MYENSMRTEWVDMSDLKDLSEHAKPVIQSQFECNLVQESARDLLKQGLTYVSTDESGKRHVTCLHQSIFPQQRTGQGWGCTQEARVCHFFHRFAN